MDILIHIDALCSCMVTSRHQSYKTVLNMQYLLQVSKRVHLKKNVIDLASRTVHTAWGFGNDTVYYNRDAKRGDRMQQNEKLKILYIEDYAEARMLMHIALRGQFEFYEAANVVEGLEKLHQSQIDVILIDLHLPGGISGYEGIQKIRELPGCADKPIIAVTAFFHHDLQRKCLELGCDDIILKPFHPVKITETIIDVWTRSRLSS